MDKFFLACNESEFAKDVKRFRQMWEDRRIFINDFFSRNNIESNAYIMGGSGSFNTPFDKAGDIFLSIEPTANDKINFKTMLCKPSSNTGLCSFKCNSKIGKIFAAECLEKQIIVNIYRARVLDYFPFLKWEQGNRSEYFETDSKFYIHIESKNFGPNSIPDGMVEIKGSEYYLKKEAEGII